MEVSRMETYANNDMEVYINKPSKRQEVGTLDELIQALHAVFKDDHINVEEVKDLMCSYKSKESEWKKFAKFDRYRYTRNLVDAGNGKFNLMILCWGEGHASPIHDHADAHCFMKILKGELEETRYEWPEAEEKREIPEDLCYCASGNKCSTPCTDGKDCEDLDMVVMDMKEIGRTRLEMDSVCYINDSLGLHRVENPSNSNPAVSLHLYCPPFDACHIFNQQTGQKTKVMVTFWSKYGEKDKELQDTRQSKNK